MIDNFKVEPYTFLSNMYPSIVVYNNNKYPTVEHAYQAAKTLDTKEQYKIWLCNNPYEAKKIGKTLTLRDDWCDVRIEIMKDLIHQKFSDKILKEKLLNTGDQELIEGNYWGDYFWGKVNGKGLNWLGKILMEERSKISNAEKLVLVSN